MDTPLSRYRVSPHDYPATLPPIEYDTVDQPRRVQKGGWISFKGHHIKLPKALTGEHVALRPTTEDGMWNLFFISHWLARIDLHQPVAATQPVTYVPEHV
jgi:hypothetical protein